MVRDLWYKIKICISRKFAGVKGLLYGSYILFLGLYTRVDYCRWFGISFRLGVDVVGDVTRCRGYDGREFQRGLEPDGARGGGSAPGRSTRDNGDGRSDVQRVRVASDRKS